MPTVSVIMPSYNHSRYIGESIESILSQSYGDIELIIIDDASVDRSTDIIASYAKIDKRIRFSNHPVNLGIANTVNEGLDRATGEFLSFASSDDVWCSDKLREQIKILRRDSTQVVWSEGVLIDGNGKELGRTFTDYHSGQNKMKTGNLFQHLVGGNYIASQSMIFSRVGCGVLRFQNRFKYLNDFIFNLELASKLNFYFIEEPLFKYRIHGNNTIHKNRKIWEKDLFVAETYILKKFGDIIPPKAKSKLYSRIGHYLYTRKHYRYACRSYWRAIELCPGKTSYGKHYLAAYWKSLIE